MWAAASRGSDSLARSVVLRRVLREGAWPASRGGAASQWGAADADQLPAGGLVLYTTTCGALYAACARSRRARLLLQARVGAERGSEARRR